jgi:hypothetical protein
MNNPNAVIQPTRTGTVSKQVFFCIAALIGMMLLTLIVFVLSDFFFKTKAAEKPIPTAADDYPRLAANLPERVQLALNNGNAETPSGLAMFFDDKLGNNQASTNSATPTNAEVSINKPNPNVTVPRINLPVTDPSIPQPVETNQMTIAQTMPTPADTEDAQTRLERRQNSVRRGETVGSMSEVYDIEDVEPIGVVGDSKRREVLFYSSKTKQTFSVPMGSKFRNGRLEDAEIRDNVVDGVNFRRDNDGQKQTRVWGKTPSNKKKNSIEQPVLTDQPVLNPTPQPQVVRNQR